MPNLELQSVSRAMKEQTLSNKNLLWANNVDYW